MSSRTMKIFKAWSFILVAAGFYTCRAYAEHEEFNIEREWRENYSFDISALKGNDLVVDIIAGSIEVTGHDGSNINLSVNVQWRGKRESDLTQAEKDLQFLVEETANGLLVFLETPVRDKSYRYFTRSRNYRFKYDLVIQVPANMNLDLHTVMRGDIKLSGISGGVNVENITGNVLLDDVITTGTVKTISGDILAGFKQAPDLDLALYSRYGKVFCAFDYQLLPESSPIHVIREGDLTRYTRENFSRIRLEGGGQAMKLESVSGYILIKDKRI